MTSGRCQRRVGHRSLGGTQTRQGVGGSRAAVVRAGGQGGQLPGRRVPGLCHPQGTRIGRYEAVLAQGMDEGQEAVQAGEDSKEVRFRTRHELALEMLREHRSVLPHAWVTGDDEMGRNSGFREELRAMNERYLLAVPATRWSAILTPHRRPTAVRGSRRKSPSSVRTPGRRRRRTGHGSRFGGREGTVGGRGGEGPCSDQAGPSQRSRRNAGDLSRAARTQDDQAGLRSFQCTV